MTDNVKICNICFIYHDPGMTGNVIKFKSILPLITRNRDVPCGLSNIYSCGAFHSCI